MLKSFKVGYRFISIQPKAFNSISTTLDIAPESKQMHDTIFIRHAHSEFNRACQDYRIKNKIEYDWDALCNHPGFQDAVAYNPKYFDCPLTQKGIEQCYLTSQQVNLKDVDVILVSPHQRALQTCSNIFKFSKYQFKLPTIVEPLVAGSLWSSCDISKDSASKKKQFPLFDFSRMSNQPEMWYIQNLRFKDKKKIYSQIARRKLKTFKDKQMLVLEMLKNKEIEEDRQILRERAWNIKKLMKKVKQKHCNMLVISHYYIIQYVNTRSFNDHDHTPIDDVDLKNCYPYYNNLQQLFNYR